MMQQELDHMKDDKKKLRKILEMANRKYPGCKGVNTSFEYTYFLRVDEHAGEKLQIALFIANKIRETEFEDVDFRLGLKVGDRHDWNIAIDFLPYSDDIQVPI